MWSLFGGSYHRVPITNLFISPRATAQYAELNDTKNYNGLGDHIHTDNEVSYPKAHEHAKVFTNKLSQF